MFRSTLIAAGAVLLCSTGYSQQQLDPAKIHPVTVPVRDAGVFNWDTKQWVSGPKANRLKAAPYNVFTNTCTWTGGGFYYGHEHCEDVVDTGRIPGTGTPLSSLEGNPTQISGITDDQIINNFQFAYCMFWQTGQVDIKVGFYNNLRGDCAAGIPVSGGGTTLSTQAVPFGTLTAYFDFGSAAGFPLLGSSVNGAQACWIITLGFADNGGFCMDSEGEGTWDNDQMMDLFSWSFQHGNPNSVYGANGPLIQGDASTGGWGSGAYNIPAGTDAFTGQPCGTGFGTSVDGWWLNIDGSAPGVANTVTFPGGTPQTCIGASGFGTNCYWFGGWPANPLGSFWMAMGSVGSCDDCNNRASNYCTAGTSAAGCNALISATGTSSANSSSGFFLSATGVQGQRTDRKSVV